MGFLYTASFQTIVYTSTTDGLFYLKPFTNPILVHWMELAQTTDLGDAQEEVLPIGLYLGGSGEIISGLTEVAVHDTAPAASTEASRASTAPTGGTLISMIYWPIRKAGPIWVPEPASRPRVSLFTHCSFRLLTAPADPITVSGTICWEEL